MGKLTTLKVGNAVSAGIGLEKAVGDRKGGVSFERRVIETPVEVPEGLDEALVSGPDMDGEEAFSLLGGEDGHDDGAPLEATARGGESPLAGIASDMPADPGPAVEIKVRYGVATASGFTDVTEQLEEIDEVVRLDGMDVEAFIDARHVPRERVVGAYWVTPRAPGAAKVLRLLREAMKMTNRVAVVRWSKTTNQAVGVVAPHRSGALLLLELAFAGVTRDAPPTAISPLEAATITSGEVAAARRLVEAFSDRPIALHELEDERVVLRQRLFEAAQDGNVEDFGIPEHPAWLDDDVEEAFLAAVGDAT